MDPCEAPVALNLIKGFGSKRVSHLRANSGEKITTWAKTIDLAGQPKRFPDYRCFAGASRHF
jgi:hypothetical protein